MALLLPVIAYDAWVFYRVEAFASFMAIQYVFPHLADFAWALGPAAMVAAAAWLLARAQGLPPVPAPEDRPARRVALHFAIWLGLAGTVIVAHPVNFSLQFLVGVGVPLLGLAALALASFPPVATYAATAALASAAAIAVQITLLASPSWYVPSERLVAARALRAACRPGERLLSPPDIGLYAGGYSACTPYVSHAAAAGFDEREAEVRRFYEARDPAWGAALLDRACIAHLVLPLASPLEAHAGAGAPFHAVAVAGRAPRAIVVYSRTGPPPCAAVP
jgi:hypothetical protein